MFLQYNVPYKPAPSNITEELIVKTELENTDQCTLKNSPARGRLYTIVILFFTLLFFVFCWIYLPFQVVRQKMVAKEL